MSDTFQYRRGAWKTWFVIFDYLIFQGFFAQADSVCNSNIHRSVHFASKSLSVSNNTNFRRVMFAKWSQVALVTVCRCLSFFSPRLELVAPSHSHPIVSLGVSTNLRRSHYVSAARYSLGHSQIICSSNLLDSASSSPRLCQTPRITR
jgi:hypothetical protein